MKQLTKNEKILVSVIVILIFIFVFNGLIIKPLREKLSKAGEDVNRLQLLQRKYIGLESQREAIAAAYMQVDRYLSLKGTEDEKMTLILSKIESEARKAGLIIIDMKSDSAKSKTKSLTPVYRIRLNAEADMPKIVSFINGLENADIFLKLDKVNISVKDEETGAMKLEAIVLGISIA